MRAHPARRQGGKEARRGRQPLPPGTIITKMIMILKMIMIMMIIIIIKKTKKLVFSKEPRINKRFDQIRKKQCKKFERWNTKEKIGPPW